MMVATPRLWPLGPYVRITRLIGPATLVKNSYIPDGPASLVRLRYRKHDALATQNGQRISPAIESKADNRIQRRIRNPKAMREQAASAVSKWCKLVYNGT
jgi:hypothetical protein